MKNILYIILLFISIKITAQCTWTVTASYTAPSCPSCCDGIIQGGVQGVVSCAMATSTLQPLGISTPNWKYVNLCAGSYTVIVSDGCACIGICGVSLPSGTTAIKEFSEKNNIKIYPNPASNTLYLSSENFFEAGTEIEITNYLGQIILRYGFKKEIDVSQFPNGYYILKIINSNSPQIISKFIKE